MQIVRSTFLMRVAAILLLLSASLSLAAKKADKSSSKPQAKTVDSGSFGIYVDNKRVATETFRIEQTGAFSTVTSEFRTEVGEKIIQNAELRVAANGEFRHYTWNEKQPGKGQLSVEDSGGFLVENIAPDPPEKAQSITLLLTPATAVLDDYMFSHREILLWRYMAQSCGSAITSECSMPTTQFGALVPRQHTSAVIAAEYKGKEKTTVKGVEKNLDRFALVFDGEEWVCYLDENMKLVKVLIPAEKTEVVRD